MTGPEGFLRPIELAGSLDPLVPVPVLETVLGPLAMLPPREIRPSGNFENEGIAPLRIPLTADEVDVVDRREVVFVLDTVPSFVLFETEGLRLPEGTRRVVLAPFGLGRSPEGLEGASEGLGAGCS